MLTINTNTVDSYYNLYFFLPDDWWVNALEFVNEYSKIYRDLDFIYVTQWDDFIYLLYSHSST